jgi:hypothetical protein
MSTTPTAVPVNPAAPQMARAGSAADAQRANEIGLTPSEITGSYNSPPHAATTVAAVTAPPESVNQIIQDIANQYASQYGVNAATLYRIAMATVQQESGGNPNAVGDSGHSVGLFQLNDQGEGAGMSVAAREDPRANASIAMRVIAQQLAAHPNWTPGQVAAAAQRPANPAAYANSVNSIYNGGTATGAQDGAAGPAAPAPAPASGQNAVNPQQVGYTPNAQGGVDPNDPVALRNWVAQNLGAESWMLNIPELTAIVDQAAGQGWTSQRFLSAVEQTNWWKTTTQAQQAYLALQNTNPAELSFTNPGSQASQKLAQVQQMAGQYGTQLNSQQLQQVATQAMQYGWSQDQIQQNLATYVRYNPSGGANNAAGIVQQLQASAGQYLVTLGSQNLQTWAQQLAGGTKTMNDYNAYLQQQAMLKYPGMAPQLQQGFTVEQIVDPLRQEAAKVLERSPDSINFTSDPLFAKALQYVPPGTQGQGPTPQPGAKVVNAMPLSQQPQGAPAQPRLMTTSELDQYLKADPNSGYEYTQQARAGASTVVSQIVNMWGKAATQ